MGKIKSLKRLKKRLKKNRFKVSSQFDRAILDTKKSLDLAYARGWQNYYSISNSLYIAKNKYGRWLVYIGLVLLTIIGVLSTPSLQNHIEPFFQESKRFEDIKALFLSIGGALVGATAITFSLIMFAMQVNVERMPHGLFRKFSSDRKLLATFAVTFLLAIITATLSLIPNKTWLAMAILTSSGCTFLIILLFLYAYRRALSLISPTMQLKLVVQDVGQNFKMWDDAARRTSPIIKANSNHIAEENKIREKYDLDRVTYFQLNPGWTIIAEKGILYCITFSRRFAEQGDHEISKVALNGVVTANALYIKTKGKTFFSETFIIENPLASDRFLTNTLEQLRQNIQIGVSRKDEQFIEQNLHAFLELILLYVKIGYGDEQDTPSHANLIATYLTNAVESIAPQNLIDVLIEAISILGNAASLIIKFDKSRCINTITEKITNIALIGSMQKSYLAVSQVAVKQLANISFDLIRSEALEECYTLEDIRANIKSIAKVFINTPDNQFTSIHSMTLAPYYSATKQDSFYQRLVILVNALKEAEHDDDAAKRVLNHVVEWADKLYDTEKELLVHSIEKRSKFTFDLVHWIVNVTKLLLALSCSDICDGNNSKKLKRSANWLINVLSWIPDDIETIKYVEMYRIADNVFDCAIEAFNRNCYEEAIEYRKLLINWMQKAGKYQTGWASLEKVCCGLVCLNIILDLPEKDLLNTIDDFINSEHKPDINLRSRVACRLQEEADKYHPAHAHDAIDSIMAQIDQAKFSSLTHKVSNHLCPELLTKNTD